MRWIAAILIIISVAIFSGVLDFEEAYEAKKASLTIHAPGATPEQMAVIKQTGKLLFTTCDGLKKYASDIEQVEASIGGIGSRNAGWVKGVNFKIKIADNPSSLPNKWRAAGHNLFYTVVGDKRPGIDIGKSTAGWFCGVGDTSPFIDEPRGVIVDQLT
ncbi:hypothetical protein [Sulfuriflexus mobilis]|uniref:hypothetical protein n=1 Tax=Sulfuriflexus mobilis TaxID=1811807 RepID=UPI000F83B416|nr:hypothetical protein [Sulfuriflexus mobilis]